MSDGSRRVPPEYMSDGPWEVAPPHEVRPEPSLKYLLDRRGTPVVDAMRHWLSGDVSVPSLAEFFDRYGRGYRDHLRTMFDRDSDEAKSLEGIRDFARASMEHMLIHTERDRFISEFSFAVPTREALDRICRFSPLLEIGAGSGAWAKLLAMRGADIIATDPALEGFQLFFGSGGRWAQSYYPVLPLHGKTAVRRWLNRNVFCSWPSLNQTWLRQAARAMPPGRVLLVVREAATADERTWDDVEYRFKPLGEPRDGWVDNSIELPTWHFLHDHLEVWQKKTRRELDETPLPEKPNTSDQDEC